jgi:hypothetical protein
MQFGPAELRHNGPAVVQAVATRRLCRILYRMHHRRERSLTGSLLAIVIVLCLLPAAETGAQTEERADEVFAPFVSRLRLAIRDPQVRITWEDSPDLITTYRVYRSTEPITNESFPQAELVATVEPGEEAFIDIPPEPGDYYYSVLAERPSGTPYRIVIPGRNASFRAVAIENIATEAERAARIVRIDAALVRAQGQPAIEVTAVADRDGRTIAIYRSTDPLDNPSDLENASLVREVPSGAIRVIDLPVPGVPYYYAAVDSGLLLAGNATVAPGENATAAPTEIPLRTAAAPETAATEPPSAVRPRPSQQPQPAEPATRPDSERGRQPEPSVSAAPFSGQRRTPLPFLKLDSDLVTGRRLGDTRIVVPRRAELPPEAEADIAALTARVSERPSPDLSPSILPPDQLPDPEGAEYTLRTVLDGPFARMAWESVVEQLDNFLSLPLTSDLEARAHFYRAQAYYFMGDRPRAILEFLLARDRYYVRVQEWLRGVLQSVESDRDRG